MRKILILAVAAILLASCEKEIPINFDQQEPHVVVKAEGTVGQPITVNITKSRPIYGIHTVNEGFPHVTNATVSLVVNEGSPMTATGVENNYTFSYTPVSGDRLQLRVEVPGFDPITASDVVPNEAHVGSATADSIMTEWGYAEYTLRFTIDDPADEHNYYSVKVLTVVENNNHYDTQYCYFSCNDILLTSNDVTDILYNGPDMGERFGGMEMFFTDESIDGHSHEIVLNAIPIYSYLNGTHYIVEVNTYSRDLYLYQKSINNSSNDVEEILDFFSEPTQIHSNMDGAWGIFAFRATKLIDAEQP